MGARPHLCDIETWLAEPMSDAIRNRLNGLAANPDVRHIAVLPDVHLAGDFCVGTAVATRSRVVPGAVGGDIGCGMCAVRIELAADRISDPKEADRLLQLLACFVPTIKHGKKTAPERLPEELLNWQLSAPQLARVAERDGRLQLGSLGRGNHFLEFQADEENRLWLLVHSGSRGVGQAINRFHMRRTFRERSLDVLEANSRDGHDYLRDVAWARCYAKHNRLSILNAAAELLRIQWSAEIDRGSWIESDHNHIQRESHFGAAYWVHRKGTQSAGRNEPGIIPGSMGSCSYHVIGSGKAEALRSSSHGAGRRQSRTIARCQVTANSLKRELRGVFYDKRKVNLIRDEAPSAYKSIYKVMKAQRDLVKVVRVLRPLVSYKGV